MNIETIYFLFVACALVAFIQLRPDIAVLTVYLGGWLVLPVGNYPADQGASVFPYWVTGLAVPSDMLVTKAWIGSVAAWIGVILFDRQAVRKLRFMPIDIFVFIWCAWPLLQGSFTLDAASLSPVTSTLYLLGCWALPWFLGRTYFSSQEGLTILAQGVVVSGLLCLPVSLIEGFWGPSMYEALYGNHPFRFDGAERYIGYRPIAFFEHGTQFGLWVSMCALLALWLAVSAPEALRRKYRWSALVLIAMALAAQSVGGTVLLFSGVGFLWVSRRIRLGVVLAVVGLMGVVGQVVYMVGDLPVTRIAKGTPVGIKVVETFKSLGRGSLTWRIAQDQKLLPLAMKAPIAGFGTWDWWRSAGTRPWGLMLLVAGQFGLIGLAAVSGLHLWPVWRVAWANTRGSISNGQGIPAMWATVILLVVIDAMLNSFIFFPAVVAAGALSTMMMSAKG